MISKVKIRIQIFKINKLLINLHVFFAQRTCGLFLKPVINAPSMKQIMTAAELMLHFALPNILNALRIILKPLQAYDTVLLIPSDLLYLSHLLPTFSLQTGHNHLHAINL